MQIFNHLNGFNKYLDTCENYVDIVESNGFSKVS